MDKNKEQKYHKDLKCDCDLCREYNKAKSQTLKQVREIINKIPCLDLGGRDSCIVISKDMLNKELDKIK